MHDIGADVLRAGEYGYHTTMVGKIVYARPRHKWTRADWERVGSKVLLPIAEEEVQGTGLQSSWLTLLQDVTIKMLEQILDKIPILRGMDLNVSQIYWSINNFGSELIRKYIELLRRRGYFREADALEALNNAGRKSR